MKKILVIVLVGVGVTWAVINQSTLEHLTDSVFTYASDNPGTFWGAIGVAAGILALSIFGSRR